MDGVDLSLPLTDRTLFSNGLSVSLTVDTGLPSRPKVSRWKSIVPSSPQCCWSCGPASGRPIALWEALQLYWMGWVSLAELTRVMVPRKNN